MRTVQVDIVSLEQLIFSGPAAAVFATGTLGELGVYPGHTPLLTTLKPGQVRVAKEDGEEEVYYVNGGIFEVQPGTITVLADTAIRATDLDEAAALEAKEKAEKLLSDKKSDFDYSKATAELAQAVAQLRAIQTLRKKYKV